MTTDIKQWYKQTKVGMIPNDWSLNFLDEEKIDILYGYAFDSQKFNIESIGMPIIRIRDLLNSSISTFFNWEYDEKYIITRWDMLVWMDWEFNIILRENIDSLLNQRICKISSISHNISQKLLYYILIKQLKKIEEKTSFTTVKHLSGKDIRKIEIPLPTNPKEQEKIADILSSIDELIEKTDKVIETQKKLKDGLLSRLMREGEGEKIKFKNLLEKVIDNRGKTPPLQSEWIKLIETYHLNNESIWFVNIWDKRQKYVSTDTYNTFFRAGHPQKWDILFSLVWERIPQSNLVNTDYDFCIWQNLVGFRFNEKVSNIFMAQLFTSNYFKNIVKGIKMSNAQPSIKLSQLVEVELMIPRNSENVWKKLMSIDKLIANEQICRNQLETIKKWLMDKLLIGEMRVKL